MMEFTKEELQLLQGLLLVEAADCQELSEEFDGYDKVEIINSMNVARGLYKKLFNNDPIEILSKI